MLRTISFLIICSIFSVISVFAQNTIDGEHFINDLRDTSKVLHYKNEIIDIYGEDDNRNSLNLVSFDVPVKEIGFENCRIENISILNLQTKQLWFDRCQIVNIHLDSVYLEGLYFGDNSVNRTVILGSEIDTIWFSKDVRTLEGQFKPIITFRNLRSKRFNFSGEAKDFRIEQSTFIDFNLGDYRKAEIDELQIRNSTFLDNSNFYSDRDIRGEFGIYIYTININSKKSTILNNTFYNSLVFGESNISQLFELSGNNFNSYIDIHNAVLPTNIYAPYDQIKKGIAIYETWWNDDPDNPTNFNCPYCKKYFGTYDELGDKEMHDKLLKGYQSLLNYYVLDGDQQSEYDVKTEIKKHKFNWLKYTYQTNGGIDNYIHWKEAQFALWKFQNRTIVIASIFGFFILISGGSTYIISKKKKKPKPQEKRLVAIVFSDIAEYTKLMGKDERKAMKTLDLNRSVHVTMVNRHNGELLKEMGDGMLCSFQTASDAVKFCMDVERETSQHDYKLRMGVHLGEVMFSKKDVYGDGVNIASRLQNEAKAGGICISGTVYQNIRNQTDIVTEFLGERELKHVTTKVEVYGVKY